MENKQLTGGFCPSNLNPYNQGEFLDRCYVKNNTTYGAYKRELVKALVWAVDVLDGKLEIKEVVDPKAASLITHIKKSVKPHIFRKNERTNLTQLTINNLPIELLNRFKRCAIEHFPDKRDKLSCLTDYAQKLYVKVEDGLVNLVETNNKSDNSFISDNSGQITSVDINDKNELIKLMDNRIKQLEQSIERKIVSTIQSTFNIVSKPFKKGKKVITGTVKSYQREEKLKKAEKILDNIMKWNEHGFTINKYEKSLVKLIGQGDPRTIRSDLEMLKHAGLIKKVRNNAHGTAAYEFIENNKYHLYNNDVAKKRFFDDVKEKFFKDDAFRLKELNDFIFEKYELFDDISQKKRLQWLISEGCVRRHDVNPRLLLIQK